MPASSRKSPSPNRNPEKKTAQGDQLARWLDALLPAGIVGSIVAAVLVPSENVARTGSHITLVVLMLLLLLIWAGRGLLRDGLVVRLDRATVALLVLTVVQVVAALACWYRCAPRPLLNMLWLGIATTVLFWLVRQMFVRIELARMLLIVLLGMAWGESLFGLYQVTIDYSRDRAAYEKNPEANLREAGFDPREGSPQRTRFENRLYSNEPTGTFSLTNSLAGFLTPWLLFLAALAILPWRGEGLYRPRLAMLISVGLLIFICWFLTRSRTAYVGTFCGLLVAIALAVRHLRLPWKKILIVAGVLLLLLVVGLIGLAWFDVGVIAEVPQSMAYRLEYWQSTLRMIARYPVAGCGPGDFQDYYTAVKLPQASEEVADPHNFLLEIWATGGSFVGIAWLVFGFCFFTRLWWRWELPRLESFLTGPNDLSPSEQAEIRFQRRCILAGVPLGLLPAGLSCWIIGVPPKPVAMLCVVVMVWLCAGLFKTWITKGDWSPWMLLVPLLGTGVHLLGAGGIFFPGVAWPLWTMGAILIAQTDRPGEEKRLSRSASAAVLIGTIPLLVLCFVTAYRPVLEGRTAYLQAQGLLQIAAEKEDEIPPEEFQRRVMELLQQAAADDPYWEEPQADLTWLYLQQWLARDDEPSRRSFEDHAQRLREITPRTSSTYRQIAWWQVVAWRRFGWKTHLEEAIRSMQQAVALYENSSQLHAEMAWIYQLAGRDEQARQEARRALELDAVMPHADRKLDKMILPRPEDIPEAIQPVPANLQARTLRDWMQWILDGGKPPLEQEKQNAPAVEPPGGEDRSVP